MLSRQLCAALVVLPMLAFQFAHAAPAATTTISSLASTTVSLSEWCASNSEIVSCFKKNPSQTPYCSTWNKISTQTTTTTVTAGSPGSTVYTTITVIGTPAQTSWTTSTKTESVLEPASTITSTTSVTNTIVVTTTTSQPTTCMYTGTRQPPISKRAATTVSTLSSTKTTTTTSKYCYTSSYPPAGISSACSCLYLPTPTVTSTTTTTLSGADTTYTRTETATPTITSTTTVTTTTTISNTQTVVVWESRTESITITTTSWIPAATLSRDNIYGIKYRVYSVNNDASLYNPHYDTDQLKNLAPDFDQRNGGYYYPTLRSNNGNMTWSGLYKTKYYNIPIANKTVVMQTFFQAGGDGDYTFYARGGPFNRTYQYPTNDSTSNDWLTFWVGDDAYRWQNHQKSFDVSRTTDDPSNWTRGSVTINLRQGDVVPITMVWAVGSVDGYVEPWVRLPYLVDAPNEYPPEQEWWYRDMMFWRYFIWRPCDGSAFT